MHLIDSGGLYGAEKMLLSLATEQQALGLDITILSAGEPGCGEKPLEMEAQRLGLPIIQWRMRPGINLPEARKIIRWAREQDFHVMHSHGYKFNILAGLWPRGMRPPLVTTLHGYVRTPRFSKMWLYECADRFILRRMQAVVLVDESMKADLGRGMHKSGRVHVIPNGVDISDIETRAQTELALELSCFLQAHTPVILGVGRLSREKAFDRLIEAFSTLSQHHPKAGLLIVGEGRLRAELEALVRNHNLGDRVLMPGYCDNVPALMARATALVIPSRTEGLPITLLEAMTLRLPVIASSVGAMPQALESGKGGKVLREPSAGNIAIALGECLGEVEQTSHKVRRARQKLKSDYSASAMAATYNDLYRRMLV
ncbi:glycosyltransferase [uncultured Halovibrio sp.]|uniref:glycosyltransferase n=1 Tax=uncultured Halovibrio sp. TaxID=985049 RepID=UPI0025D9BC1E|nr:glycosyltransferase [uncultured Halovibrio sp.]